MRKGGLHVARKRELTEGTAFLREVAELDLEEDADTVGAAHGGNGSFDLSSIRELGGVDNARGVVHHDGGIAEFLESSCQCNGSS